MMTQQLYHSIHSARNNRFGACRSKSGCRFSKKIGTPEQIAGASKRIHLFATCAGGLVKLAGLAVCLYLGGPADAVAGQRQISAAALAKMPARILFGHTRTPARMKPKAYGFYTKGCLAGAVQMPADGSAWQVMRPKRNRAWGHPQLIELLKRLAIEAKAYDGWNGLLVGDLSQPRGGPMLSGHASHQIGLDADVWLTPMPDRRLTAHERNTISAKLVVLDRKRINPKRWTAAHARLLRRAASYPQVQRIFVHPPIKKALCNWSRGQSNRGRWLRKIRPYYGHNYHFHIRIRCPKGYSGCKPQIEPRPADGTGCGAELAYWYSDRPWRRPKPRKFKSPTIYVNGIPLPRRKPPKPKPPRVRTIASLPPACRSVLLAR